METTRVPITVQARTQQGAWRARTPLLIFYSTVEYCDIPWHKRQHNINEHANFVQYKFHVKNALNSLTYNQSASLKFRENSPTGHYHNTNLYDFEEVSLLHPMMLILPLRYSHL